MSIPAGFNRLAVDERIACRGQDDQRRGSPPRAIALQVNHTTFYWQALGLTAAFIMAAMMGAPAAHGAETGPALGDSPSGLAQVSKRDKPLTKEEGEREVRNADAF
ncbi:MAG: hypothetical protein AB7S70_00705 [Hyphomicrobium sp.]|uniref:hypothetical protein n=1 Tax=Hyphomicrobium sp. TaxID=82 RepID=UPI003D14F279